MSEFDFNKVLKIVDNDQEMAVTLSQMFISQSQEDFSALLNAKNSNNIDVVGKIAHKMKSSLATLGMMSTSEILKKIELAAKSGSTIEAVEADINATSLALEEIYNDIKKVI